MCVCVCVCAHVCVCVCVVWCVYMFVYVCLSAVPIADNWYWGDDWPRLKLFPYLYLTISNTNNTTPIQGFCFLSRRCWWLMVLWHTWQHRTSQHWQMFSPLALQCSIVFFGSKGSQSPVSVSSRLCNEEALAQPILHLSRKVVRISRCGCKHLFQCNLCMHHEVPEQ